MAVGALTDSMSYVPSKRNVSLARRRVARLLADWGSPELAGDAALLAGELAANALLHGGVPDRLFRVELRLEDKTLRIAVTDPRGELLPRQREAGDEEQHGRGLAIVAALATRWGVDPLVVGKTVWAELELC
ncbi:ATP-binding protein [Streptomyces sp. LP05-1]|uniref:ATP-binding protein n=1 Tax=Streptomyces pyxinae TaxID=2970734 RepID=A0ABT2CGB2_9ACTN|nr:ATP-binding protein [Streptomyces sp. LP05-1]MCS0636457.1 ATP-binding protein [Streptomyces sp. LP05-1]